MPKVALITGGTSGIGRAVAQSLAAHGADAWSIHLIGRNVKAGEEIVSSLGSHVHFHQTDVTSYTSLSHVFQAVFAQSGSRLDFVFANAGIVDQIDFYAEHPVAAVEGDGLPPPPPEPNQHTVDISLKSVVNTAYLALHYLRHSNVPDGEVKDPSLMITASCGSIYASEFSPMYATTKHGVLGLMRAIVGPFYQNAGIRVNCLCPGPVHTNLLDDHSWSLFKKEHITSLELIVKVVTSIVAGTELVDSHGKAFAGADLRDKAVLTSGENLYFWGRPEWVDVNMAEIMGATKANEPGALKVN